MRLRMRVRMRFEDENEDEDDHEDEDEDEDEDEGEEEDGDEDDNEDEDKDEDGDEDEDEDEDEDAEKPPKTIRNQGDVPKRAKSGPRPRHGPPPDPISHPANPHTTPAEFREPSKHSLWEKNSSSQAQS